MVSQHEDVNKNVFFKLKMFVRHLNRSWPMIQPIIWNKELLKNKKQKQSIQTHETVQTPAGRLPWAILFLLAAQRTDLYGKTHKRTSAGDPTAYRALMLMSASCDARPRSAEESGVCPAGSGGLESSPAAQPSANYAIC